MFDSIYPNANFVFVTSRAYTGNLGGLAGADAICQTHAAEAGLPGTYVAWLATSTVTAPSRLASARGWIRRDGMPFADTTTDLTAAHVFYPIELDELGNPTASFPSTDVMTGTLADGTTSGQHCAEWTSTSADVSGGESKSGSSSWTFGFTTISYGCENARRIYCFGVDRVVPVIPAEPGRRTFLTAADWSAGSGIASADTLCQNEAQAAGLVGSYKALLGTPNAPPISRFDQQGLPWIRLDGIALATSTARFVNNELSAPLHIMANGVHEESTARAMTGGIRPNLMSANTCGDWDIGNPSQSWSYGLPTEVKSFFASGGTPCNQSGRLYCLQE